MSNNLELWDKVSRPPSSALKTIGAGRLKGMTDVNPQYRLKTMTEQFGQIGVGWYYEIAEFWTEPGASGEIMCFIMVNLYTRNGEAWSSPIVGLGGSALVAKESSGLRANDEGYKMALTDALSVAMKQLGIASAIYEGLWDGSKYRDTGGAVNLDDIALLEGCGSLDELQAAFAVTFPKYKGKPELMKEIVSIKDAMKSRLAA